MKYYKTFQILNSKLQPENEEVAEWRWFNEPDRATVVKTWKQ